MATSFGNTVSSGVFGQALTRVLDCVKRDKILWRNHEPQQRALGRNICLIEKYADAFILDDKDIHSWYTDLQDAMYAAVDILDACATAAEKGSIMDSKETIIDNLKDKLLNILYTISIHQVSVDCPLSLARTVQLLNERIKELFEEGKRHGYQDRIENELKRYPQLRPKPTHKPFGGLPIVGREKVKNDIINWVKDGHTGGSRMSLQILAIVGMGGIGKTTLAQSIYDTEKQNFDLPGVWIHCSSETTDAGSLLKTILSRFGREISGDTSDLEKLTTSVEDIVHNKRFLLIIDDVWNKKELRWNELLPALMGGKMGSRMIVTTREEQDVVNIDKCRRGVIAPAVKLAGMGDEELWEILKDNAFGVDEPRVPTNVEQMGKEIVKKLKGLPLAAKAVGCLLGPDQPPNKWREILDGDLWHVLKSEDHTNLVPALILSYLNLPHQLKPCFKYLSLLDSRTTHHRELVYQWLAHDYVQVGDNQSVEDAGAHIINHLESMSLLSTTRSYYNYRYIQMHDLIHDLSRASATHDHLKILDNGDIQNQFKGKSPRHLSIRVTEGTSLNQLGGCTKLRSLTIRCRLSRGSGISSVFKELKNLRVLTLAHLGIQELPNEIGELKQLRYLDVSHNPIKCLPTSIGELNHLQTLILAFCEGAWYSSSEQTQVWSKLSSLRYLDLSGNDDVMNILPDAFTLLSDLRVLVLSYCSKLGELPEGISNLKRLECLEVSQIAKLPKGLASLSRLQVLNLGDWYELKAIPSGFSDLVNLKHVYMDKELSHTISGIGKLTLLKELEEFCIKDKEGHKIDELANLNMLCGKLRIRGLESVKSKAEAQQSLLEDKVHIKELALDWSSPHDTSHTADSVSQEEVIEGLKPKAGNLTELTIENYIGKNLPSWFNSQHLRQIKRMVISNCPNLKTIGALPWSLKYLRLYNVGLTEIPQLHGQNDPVENSSRTQPLPSIDCVDIEACPSLLSLNSGLLQIQLPNLRSLIIQGCTSLQHPLPNGFMDMKSLETLELIKCPRLSALSINSNLALPAHLKSLKIKNCTSLSKQSVLESVQALTSLEALQLQNCCRDMTKSFVESVVVGQMNKLKRCTISLGSHHVDMMVGNFINLKEEKPIGDIEDCCSYSELLLVILGNIPSSIDSLTLCGPLYLSKNHVAVRCDPLESLPTYITRFSSLQMLCFNSLDYFSPEDEDWAHVEQGKAFFNLESVQHVRLKNCKALKSPPYSSFLRSLQITDCPGIRNLYSLGAMPCLGFLEISLCQNLENPPKKGFTCFVRLEILILKDCPLLSHLSMEELPCDLPSSLLALFIWNCKELQIGHIEEHISQLTSLEILVIRSCGGRMSKSFLRRVISLFGPRNQFKCRLISTEFTFQWLYTDDADCSVVSWVVESNEEGSFDRWDSLEFLVEMLGVMMSACKVSELNISGIHELEAIKGTSKEVLLRLTTAEQESRISDYARLLPDAETEKTCRQLGILLPHGMLIEGDKFHDASRWERDDSYDGYHARVYIETEKKRLAIVGLRDYMSRYE